MRMSVSRLAALSAALLAGATLAACSSSSAPIAPTGNNNQVTSFPGAPVMFLQGSPNLHLGLTAADFYVDGQKVVSLPYGAATPFILSIPAGPHTITLYQVGTANPLFTAATVVLSPNTKYAIVAEGDAGAVPTAKKPQIALFVVPHYNTPATGNPAISIFNASPRNGIIDFWYNTGSAAPAPLELAAGVTVGNSSAPTSSWKTNVALTASPENMYCFGAYLTATAVLVPGATSIPAGQSPQVAPCALTITRNPGSDANFFLIDSLTALQSVLLLLNDQNG
jgi:Domain of unknown function (DUF4397)